MPEYRFVFDALSDARVMQNAADDPGAWTFDFVAEGSALVRDVVSERNGVPFHDALEVQVLRSGDSLTDDLLYRARDVAETALVLVAAAARAPIGDAAFRVAYEVSANPDGHQLLQWISTPELPSPRSPAPIEMMDAIWTAIDQHGSADPKTAQRAVMAMSLFRRGLRETDPLFRFTEFWLALEAMNPRLADHFAVPDAERKGLSGVGRLLHAMTGSPDVFRVAVKARNDVLHANRVQPADVRGRVEPLLQVLDEAIVEGARRMLGIAPGVVGQSGSVWPFPNRFVIRAVVESDAAGWSVDRHPFFSHENEVVPGPPARPGQVSYTQSPVFTLHNAQGHGDVQFEQRGADGPNAPRPTSD